jgi:hypothetical protein
MQKCLLLLLLEIVPLKMKRFPLVLGEILLPLAGEGADRRMRVDQSEAYSLRTRQPRQPP